MNNPLAFENRRLLVIDDNRAIHNDFRALLIKDTTVSDAVEIAEKDLFGHSANAPRPAPFEIDSARHGQAGVKLVRKAREEGRPYALVFLDIGLSPGWDGVETALEIWAVDPEVQIVLCNASSDYSWDALFDKIGRRDGLVILRKPFAALEALQLAHAFTEKWSLRHHLLAADFLPPPAPCPPPSGPWLRVLLVEDNTVNQIVATRQLCNLGCQVQVAGNGWEALAAWQRGALDLIFMDCQMPAMDGFQATRRIRALELERSLPPIRIVAMTAAAMEGDRESCLQAGMDDYLSKPVKIDGIKKLLQRQFPDGFGPGPKADFTKTGWLTALHTV